MKFAAAYRREDQVLIHPESRTVTGLRQGNEPFITLPNDAETEVLGKAITEALGASRSGMPTLTDMSELVKPLLEAFHVKNWSSFLNGTVCVSVRADGDQVYFMPTRNRGAREGFRHLPGLEFPVPPDLVAMGEGLKRAFDLSEA
jgi:hypothetical protein